MLNDLQSCLHVYTLFLKENAFQNNPRNSYCVIRHSGIIYAKLVGPNNHVQLEYLLVKVDHHFIKHMNTTDAAFFAGLQSTGSTLSAQFEFQAKETQQ